MSRSIHDDFFELMRTPPWRPAYRKHVANFLEDRRSRFSVPEFKVEGDTVTFIARHAGQPDFRYTLHRDPAVPLAYKEEAACHATS